MSTAIITPYCSHSGGGGGMSNKTFEERRKSSCIVQQDNGGESFTTGRIPCLNNDGPDVDGDEEDKQLVDPHHHCDPSHGRLTNFLRHLKCSGYGKLSETCGLSISELEAMAARQARQLETQEQLLAAKAQRLRFLKSSGEAERIQRLREKVTSQEERLRKLRALRGKVQTTRNGNSVLSADLESLRAVFNEKEKELSLAVAKVDELTRQLEEVRRSGKEHPQNGQSIAALELEKLKRELLYRHKLRESQTNRVLNQKQSLSQKQEEAMRVDRRIAELQERLHRKRILNSQLAASLKHQENEEDFVSLPNKNDPKYQTLPYNAKLFAPFAARHDQGGLERNIQQMQIIQPDQVSDTYGQQQQSNQQSNQFNSSNVDPKQQELISGKQNSSTGASTTTTPSNQERIQSYNNKNNLHLNQLQNFLSHQQQQYNNQNLPRSANTTISTPALITTSSALLHDGVNSFTPMSADPSGHHLISTTSNVSSSKVNDILSSAHKASNYFSTSGSPPSSASSTSSPTYTFGEISGSSAIGQISTLTDSGYDDYNHVAGKPALPPKPAKPTPPPRQATEFNFGLRLPSSTSSEEIMMPDRTELPIKSQPLFLKNSQQHHQPITSKGSGSTLVPSSSSSGLEKESSSTTTTSTNTTQAAVRVSINRRIAMPPAFLFPESDPPPSDLIPEHLASTSSSSSSQLASAANTVAALIACSESSSSSSGDTLHHHQHQNPTWSGLLYPQKECGDDGDSTDASPALQVKHAVTFSNQLQQQLLAEEYTLPDLLLNQPSLKEGANNNNGGKSSPPQGDNSFSVDPTEELEINDANGTDNNAHSLNQGIGFMNVLIKPSSPDDNRRNQEQLDRFGAEKEGYNEGANVQGQERENSSPASSDSVSLPGVLRRVRKSNFKSGKRDQIPLGRRVSFDPLALLLDASLEGELDLVMKTANEVGNVSAANDEGITALHNAICAGHAEVVKFLVEFGCDVNAQDSDGWTPLHCAASCNNVGMVKFLVEHGACIFATTLSDHETAAEKCEEDEDGFGPCSEYLYSIQEKLGIMNNGVVYSVFDYDAQNPDELTFETSDRLVILRKGDEYEREWWWTASGEQQGYVPRNLLGLYPRVVPQKRNGDS